MALRWRRRCDVLRCKAVAKRYGAPWRMAKRRRGVDARCEATAMQHIAGRRHGNASPCIAALREGNAGRSTESQGQRDERCCSAPQKHSRVSQSEVTAGRGVVTRCEATARHSSALRCPAWRRQGDGRDRRSTAKRVQCGAERRYAKARQSRDQRRHCSAWTSTAKAQGQGKTKKVQIPPCKGTGDMV